MRIRGAVVNSVFPYTLAHAARSVLANSGGAQQNRLPHGPIVPKNDRNFSVHASSKAVQESPAHEVDVSILFLNIEPLRKRS